MMDSYERQCERQADQVAFDSAITAYTTEMERASSKRSLDTGSQSDQDSFVSATDVNTSYDRSCKISWKIYYFKALNVKYM